MEFVKDFLLEMLITVLVAASTWLYGRYGQRPWSNPIPKLRRIGKSHGREIRKLKHELGEIYSWLDEQDIKLEPLQTTIWQSMMLLDKDSIERAALSSHLEPKKRIEALGNLYTIDPKRGEQVLRLLSEQNAIPGHLSRFAKTQLGTEMTTTRH